MNALACDRVSASQKGYRSLPLLREQLPRLALLPRTLGGKPCYYRTLSGKLCSIQPRAQRLIDVGCLPGLIQWIAFAAGTALVPAYGPMIKRVGLRRCRLVA